MPNIDQAYTKNILIRTMSVADLELLTPYFIRLDMLRDDILVHANSPIEYVYFLDQGVASIVAGIDTDRPTEVGIFGWEGVSATCLLLSSESSPHQTFIQVGSGTALRIDTEPYLKAVSSSSTLRATLLRFVQAMLVQSACSTATNAHHRIEARLARWLLMCHDRVDGEELLITHEFL
jgi:CRP-like cAMP-binding protein